VVKIIWQQCQFICCRQRQQSHTINTYRIRNVGQCPTWSSPCRT